MDVNSRHPKAPYTKSKFAARTIQAAVDIARDGDLILVADGVYKTGGRTVGDVVVGGEVIGATVLTNRVVIKKTLTVKSINGPARTFILGQSDSTLNASSQAVRCVYLGSNAVMSGFTITNGTTTSSGSFLSDVAGGGVFCESTNSSISNCVFVGNSSSLYGGGAFSGKISDCIFINNASQLGGGATASVLTRCVFSNNVASYGGGATSHATVLDSVVVSNRSTFTGGGVFGSFLARCFLSKNVSDYAGGGASGGTLYQCLLTGNSSQSGGAASASRMDRCVISNNVASYYGGGIDSAFANQCLVISNRASAGGGAYASSFLNSVIVGNTALDIDGGSARGTAINSIIYYNVAPVNPNGLSYGLLWCCTPNLTPQDLNCITNDPLFVDVTTGDFRLRPDSSCINSGRESQIVTTTNTTDFVGNPRVVGEATDIGLFEFQSPSSILSYSWARQHGLKIDGRDDYADPDGDGHNNRQEFMADTNPSDAESVLKISSIESDAYGVSMSWKSSPNRRYTLERSTDLINFEPIYTDYFNYSDTITLTDYWPQSGQNFYYRIRVR